jgi:NifB/MoaA-like Fe-S oxidoreductase
MRLLGVERGGEIVEQLRELTAAGIEVHTQVVLCPGWNDGEHLERTIADLWSLGPNILSLSVVPVGLTQYNLDRPVHLLTAVEARTALAQMDAARARSYRERGTGWLYAGDELFFIAEAPMPEAAYYDDWPLTENGVGAVRRLLDDFEVNAGSVRRLEGRRIAIVTGERMAPVLSPLAARLSVQTGASIDVVPVANRLFGPTVTTAGLLAGRDIEAVLATQPAFDLVLLPAESLNDDAMFIDSVPLAELEAAFAPAILLPAHELTAALASQ